MKFRDKCLRIVVAACMACGSILAFADDLSTRKNILYLSTEGLDHKYFSEAYTAFKDELDKTLPQKTVVYAENLDLAKFITPEYRTTLTEWLRTKYGAVHFDAIVTAGSPALKFAAETQLWPGVPTYFSHANEAVVRPLSLPPNFTGQTYSVSLEKTFELIQKLLPKTRRIALVGNAGPADIYRSYFATELDDHERAFKFIDLRGKSLTEVLTTVSSLEEDTVVHYRIGFSRTASGQLFDSISTFEMMAAAANRPVFVDHSPLIGLGALGGVAVDPEPQGRNAARRVAELLAAAKPADIPVTRLEFQPTFDWRQLKRWGIAEADLPPSSQVWFYTPTIWEQYRLEIISAISAIAVLGFLVLALLVERRRRSLAVAESRSRLAELAHLNRNATAMVYSGAIAHELNQPLAAILSNAQAARLMLAMDPPALDDIREILDDIERDDQRASELIRGMRGLLKKGEVRHEVLDINSVISRAVLFIRPEATMRQVGIRMRLPEEPVHVLGDRIQLQQVLINLVINSMDAMADLPPATRLVEITALIDRADDVDIVVTDAGPGFPGDVTQAFQSFTTTKTHGTGLGLAITAALVREHSGKIIAANLEGRGARVTVSLPRVAADARPVAMQALQQDPSATFQSKTQPG